MSGDAYLLADTAQVQKLYKEKLEKKHIYWPKDQDVPMGDETLMKMLAPGVFKHMEAYSELRATKQGNDGAFLADLDHWPEGPGGSCGPLFPCQLTHGTVKSWNGKRLFLGSEHLAANGWNLFPSSSSSPVSPLLDILLALTDREQKQLSGNGMHLPSLCAWKLYVFGNLVRVESAKLVEECRLAGKGNADADEGEDEADLADRPQDASDDDLLTIDGGHRSTSRF